MGAWRKAGIMIIVLGGVLGAFMGLLIGAGGLVALGQASPWNPLAPLLAPWLGGWTLATWIVLAISAAFLLTLIPYVIITLALARPIAALSATPLPLPPVTLPLPFHPVEGFFRGHLIGLAAALNYSLWLLLPFGAPLGLPLGLLGFLAVFPAVSRQSAYQALLGWSSWLRPTTWLVLPLGLLLFLIDLPTLAFAPPPAGIRLDLRTGTIETTGGFFSRLRPFGGATSPGFNVGNWTFLTPSLGGLPTPFHAPGLSAHENGHTLTLAAFGGLFGAINAVDENLPPFRRGGRAYGELVPESYLPQPRRPHVRVWS
jgi:hypothetical protein